MPNQVIHSLISELNSNLSNIVKYKDVSVTSDNLGIVEVAESSGISSTKIINVTLPLNSGSKYIIPGGRYYLLVKNDLTISANDNITIRVFYIAI